MADQQIPKNPVDKLLLGASIGFQIALLLASWMFVGEAKSAAADEGTFWQEMAITTVLIVVSIGLAVWGFRQNGTDKQSVAILTAAYISSAIALSAGTILLTYIYGAMALWRGVDLFRQ